MYQPEPKQAKATLDAAIHQLAELQKSPEGWQLADGLLHSSNSQVRFFGKSSCSSVSLPSSRSSFEECTFEGRLKSEYASEPSVRDPYQIN